MNKYILSLFFFAITIYAQEPEIKFYLDDGSFKSYLISDIDSLSVSKSDSKYVMHIYYQDTNIAYYPNEIIQSVKIEKGTNENHYLNVYIFGYPKPYLVFDIDSIVFKIDKWQPLTIGSQVWMLKNLDVDHYRNGDSIPEIRDEIEWNDSANNASGAWCYYNNSDSLGKIYGKLYNWYTVNDSRGFTPDGWHVPTDEEWTELTEYLFGDNVAGELLKETGTAHWESPNTATNESGFSALPGGWRMRNGTFSDIGDLGYWWSATENDATSSWYRCLGFCSTLVYIYYINKACGFSVRCVKDGK